MYFSLERLFLKIKRYGKGLTQRYDTCSCPAESSILKISYVEFEFHIIINLQDFSREISNFAKSLIYNICLPNLEFCFILNFQHLPSRILNLAKAWISKFFCADSWIFIIFCRIFEIWFAASWVFLYPEFSRFVLPNHEFHLSILKFQDLSRRIFNFAKSWIFQIFPANIEFCKILNFSDLFCRIRNFAKFWNSRFAPTDLEFF